MNEFAPPTARPVRRVRKATRKTSLLSSFLVIVALAAGLSGCGGPAPQGDSGSAGTGTSAPNGMPELTDEVIRERINYTRIWEVPEENGAADPIVWNFAPNEPKEIRVVERQQDGNRATLILDITTSSAPGARNPRHLAGQIRTEWELKTGWLLRKWEITSTENISMKYKNLPKPPPVNSNK